MGRARRQAGAVKVLSRLRGRSRQEQPLSGPQHPALSRLEAELELERTRREVELERARGIERARRRPYLRLWEDGIDDKFSLDVLSRDVGHVVGLAMTAKQWAPEVLADYENVLAALRLYPPPPELREIVDELMVAARAVALENNRLWGTPLPPADEYETSARESTERDFLLTHLREPLETVLQRAGENRAEIGYLCMVCEDLVRGTDVPFDAPSFTDERLAKLGWIREIMPTSLAQSLTEAAAAKGVQLPTPIQTGELAEQRLDVEVMVRESELQRDRRLWESLLRSGFMNADSTSAEELETVAKHGATEADIEGFENKGRTYQRRLRAYARLLGMEAVAPLTVRARIHDCVVAYGRGVVAAEGGQQRSFSTADGFRRSFMIVDLPTGLLREIVVPLLEESEVDIGRCVVGRKTAVELGAVAFVRERALPPVRAQLDEIFEKTATVCRQQLLGEYDRSRGDSALTY